MEARILECLDVNEAMSSAELATMLGENQRTVQRTLTVLVKAGRVVRTGRGPATRYERVTPLETAFGWEPAFLENYVPNKTYYLDEEDRRALRALGMSTEPLPAGTYARRILDRLLIDLSWASSRLEGNTYSLLDTEELIKHGHEPDGRTALETQMVLNHKAAIEYLVNGDVPLRFEPVVIRSIHALLSDNLLADPTAGGALRTREVRITGTRYIPLANPDRLRLAFEMLLAKAAEIRDPFEASLFMLVQLPYLQPFVDVNKRVSRLAANIPFVTHNCYPLSFIDTPQHSYLEAVLAVYERRDPSLMARLFVSSYRQSATKYGVIAESIGEPNPIYLRYREVLKSCIPRIVRQELKLAEVTEAVLVANFGVDPADAAALHGLLLVQLASLHEGNAVTYRLHPAEVVAWRANGSPR